MSRGTIFLLGGINDFLFVTRSWTYGLSRAGLPHQLVTLRWQQGILAALTFKDLWNTRHHHEQASRLAEMLRSCRQQKPDEPVHVISHSAGTAITVYALEQLAPDDAITSAILVGSALSPDYNLTAARCGTRQGLLSVESPLDCLFLGVGTTLLGTANRKWRPAAGMVGFNHLPTMTTLRRWNLADVRFGWLGGHLSVAAPGFSRAILAPWIRSVEAAVNAAP